MIENVTRAVLLGALKDIKKSLSVIFQSEGYEILNPSIGFSTVKNGFVVWAIAFDFPLLLAKVGNNDDDKRIIVNSRYLVGGKYTLVFMSELPRTYFINYIFFAALYDKFLTFDRRSDYSGIDR
jgi:hypothetical protein